MPTITGGITFKKGEAMPEKLVEELKVSGIRLPFDPAGLTSFEGGTIPNGIILKNDKGNRFLVNKDLGEISEK